MAGHGHHHNPIAGLNSWRDWVTTGVLLVLAFFDLWVGLVLMNPAILAEAWHNFFDATYTLATGILKMITSRSPSHSRSHHWPAVTGIALCVMTVLGTAALTTIELFEPVDSTVQGGLVAAALGVIGFAVNYPLAKLMQRGGSGYDRGNEGHLAGDAVGSLILIPTGLVGAWVASNVADPGRVTWWVYFIGSLLIIGWVAQHNYRTSRELASELRDCLREDRGHAH
jgi:Co/Zn/Cd efflux system component